MVEKKIRKKFKEKRKKPRKIPSKNKKTFSFSPFLPILQTILREKPIFFANAYDFLAKKLGNLNNF